MMEIRLVSNVKITHRNLQEYALGIISKHNRTNYIASTVLSSHL